MKLQRRISVALFSNALVCGGAEQHIITLLQGLDRKIFAPHLVCPPELAEKIEVPADVPVTPIRIRCLSDVGGAIRLVSFLRGLRIDILHSHLFRASMFAAPVAKAAGVPVVIETPHVRELWRKGWKAHYGFDRLVGRAVDYYIAVSEANGHYLVHEKGLPARKMRVIKNGCDLARFNPATPPPAGLRQQLGFGVDDPVIAIFGRLEVQKGHSVLLEAMVRVHSAFPAARLVCVGEGSLRGELEACANSLGIAEAVRFVGFQQDVASWLALAEFTVLSSFFEGLPLSAMESLAAGRTLVATAVDGTPEIVWHGETGILVPPGDPAALAEGMLQLLEDGTARQRMAEVGCRLVRSHFTDERQVRQTEELYLASFTEKTGYSIEAQEPRSQELANVANAALGARR